MESKNGTVTLAFTQLLTLIFVVAKLWHVIEWPWWLVLMPVLLPIGMLGVTIVTAWLFLKIKGEE